MLFGGTRELANSLAEQNAFPLASHEHTDLAKVTQYISTKQDRTTALEAVEEEFQRQVSERLRNGANRDGETPDTLLEQAIQRSLSDPEHPYRILADLPASIYLNASYEKMLYRSLKESR
jgi:hypothetical protein